MKKKEGKCSNGSKTSETYRKKIEDDPVKRNLLDKEWLNEKYRTKSSNEIATLLGVSNVTVLNYFRKFGLELNEEEKQEKVKRKFVETYKNGTNTHLFDKTLFDEQYSFKTTKQISEESGLTEAVVKKLVEFHGTTVSDEDRNRNILVRRDPKYGILFDPKELKEAYDRRSLGRLTEELGISASTIGIYLKKYGIERNNWKNRSGVEQEICDFIESLGDSVVRNSRSIIPPKELDIFVPNKKLAIELNGVYWHSVRTLDEEAMKKNRHYDKTVSCEKNGIQLLHIFDTEWFEKNSIWKSVIKNKLGLSEEKVFARKCSLVEVSKNVGRDFFETTHLQGACSGGTYYGLEYAGELVSCIQIGESRFSKKHDFEVLRFSNKLDTYVVGGFSRLMKHIPVSGVVVSYANRRWSNGSLYMNNGFELNGHTTPNYWYWSDNDKELKSRLKYQKHKLVDVLETFDDTKTEAENMYDNGFRKMYDSGNLVFETHK